MVVVVNGGMIYLYDLFLYIRGVIDGKMLKKKVKLLILMEKVEFLFILEIIKVLNEKGELVSRWIILEYSKNI